LAPLEPKQFVGVEQMPKSKLGYVLIEGTRGARRARGGVADLVPGADAGGHEEGGGADDPGAEDDPLGGEHRPLPTICPHHHPSRPRTVEQHLWHGRPGEGGGVEGQCSDSGKPKQGHGLVTHIRPFGISFRQIFGGEADGDEQRWGFGAFECGPFRWVVWRHRTHAGDDDGNREINRKYKDKKNEKTNGI